MQVLTALVLAGFGVYVGAWYFGEIEGNFALLLFMATLVTGLYWLAERFYFAPQRRRAAAALEVSASERLNRLAAQGIGEIDDDSAQQRSRTLSQPWWLDWTAGLFPVILVVFLLRSFLFEPFKIPSGSMIPTLQIGDLILVNKFTYGLRLPVLNIKITEGNAPQRGDVMVFRYPPKPSLDYIKRVIGVPGDEVSYLNKRLSINGKPVELSPQPQYLEEDRMKYIDQFQETIGKHTHGLLIDNERPAFVSNASDFQYRDQCRYSVEGVVCKVPEGHYFMMGDNRDNSLDSRYWGFVPEKNIVGKAFFVWMNFSNLKRIGSFD
ncbi:MAG: signal peptidase I [Burkholderiales bacterium]